MKTTIAISIALFAQVSFAANPMPQAPAEDGLVQTVGVWKAVGCVETEAECEALAEENNKDEMRVSGERETCKETALTCYVK